MKEYRYPRLLQIVAAFCLAVTFGLAILSWLAYVVDGISAALYLMPLWLLMGLYWVYTLATMPRRIRFEAHHLVIVYTWGEQTLPYAEIQTVRAGWLGLLIVAPRQRVTVSSIYPNIIAAIRGELEQRVPVAQAEFRQRFAEFPLCIKTRRLVPVVSLVFGLLLILLTFGLANYAVTTTDPISTGDWVLMLVMGLSWLALASGLCYAVLFAYVWRYTFTSTTLHARFTLWQRTWQVGDIRSIELVGEEAVSRGMRRTHWRIDIHFTDATKLAVSPSQWGAWMANCDVEDELLLRQLAARLHALYVVAPAAIAPQQDAGN